MSELFRKLQKPGLPPMNPPKFAGRAPQHKKRDYTPLPWISYFETKRFVQTTRGTFCTYTKGSAGPLIVALHGGGFSALTWALFAKELIGSAVCQVMAFDQRGHGETVTDNDSDLSISTLAADVGAVISGLYGEEVPPIVLLGHSMGGAVAVHSSKVDIVPSQIGLIVVDVVEGTAIEALNGMRSVLRSRPPKFKSLEHAIEWSVRSGQIKNSESARVSMIGQVKPSIDPVSLHATAHQVLTSDAIKEEDESTEEAEESHQSVSHGVDDTLCSPCDVPHVWRIDLEKTEGFWTGWFQGLSALFLSIPVPKILLLAGVDRLDKELAVGQMQGKFQMQVLGHVGHAVHEDAPDQVADVVATFLVRHKFTEPGENFNSASIEWRVGTMR